MELEHYTQQAVSLLKSLIAEESFSKEEDETANLIVQFLKERKCEVNRIGNNVWSRSDNFSDSKPTILLNSHHDTVQAGVSWTRDPLSPDIENGILYGLGSNDAGASLVSLLQVFLHFKSKDMPWNLVYLASAEEENSGEGGVLMALPKLPPIDFGIVGEPTKMEIALAEKGLVVLDCKASGKTGHAARNEGENALYIALEDIHRLRNYVFKKESPFLGPIKATTTMINAGSQHNVVPDTCTFVVDVRVNELYSNAEVVEEIRELLQSEVKPRSLRMNSSGIPLDHPVAIRAKELNIPTYGSPTLSDQTHMHFPTIKMGPGDSARSHTPDEYILIEEIEKGIQKYIELLSGLKI
ncbi:MAG: M20 family metallo-hydrolase [Cyclobacteriaceae bacterium]|nr:M20 family metallo-hydrolase [Cyclobacteriaceae bacterium]